MDLSPHYFNGSNWQKRVDDYLKGQGVDLFVRANYEAITRSLLDPQRVCAWW